MKTDRNQRLSEHLLNVGEELLANAYEIDDAEKLKAYKKAKPAPVTLLHRRSVWMPVAAAAACVALAVGLWQGGVFAPAQLPVEPPTEGTTTEATEPTDTDVVTDPTDTTTKEPDADTTTDGTADTTTDTKQPDQTETTETKNPTVTDKTDPTKTEKPTPLVTGGTDKTEPTKNTTTGKDKPTTKPTTGKTKPTTKTEPTKTTATKTDPTTQTTKIDVSDWPVIVADTPQYVSSDGSLMWYGPKGGYLDYYLKEKMKIHDGEDVLYAVVIEVLLYLEEYNGFWQSTEELAQIDKEYWDAYHAYEEEAKKLNPDYPDEKVSVWSEEMRVKYDLYRSLRDKRQDIEDQQKFAYYRSFINPRVDYLKEVITTEMISIAEDGKYYTAYGYVGFYAELPAETLLQLEAYGDYVVRLVSPEGDLVRND